MTKHEPLYGYVPFVGPFFIQIPSELKMLQDAEALFDAKGTLHKRQVKTDLRGVESVMLWREKKGMINTKQEKYKS